MNRSSYPSTFNAPSVFADSSSDSERGTSSTNDAWKCGSLSSIFTHPPEDNKKKNELYETEKQQKDKTYTRVREFEHAHPPATASPFGRINLEPSQARASKHRSPHSLRVRVRVVVVSRHGLIPLNMHMYLVLYTWYQVFR